MPKENGVNDKKEQIEAITADFDSQFLTFSQGKTSKKPKIVKKLQKNLKKFRKKPKKLKKYENKLKKKAKISKKYQKILEN